MTVVENSPRPRKYANMDELNLPFIDSQLCGSCSPLIFFLSTGPLMPMAFKRLFHAISIQSKLPRCFLQLTAEAV